VSDAPTIAQDVNGMFESAELKLSGKD